MEKILIIGDSLKFDNYANAVKSIGFEPEISTEFRDPEDYAGLLLPGGADIDPSVYGRENLGSEGINPEYDRLLFRQTDAFMQAEKPIFGTCRGLQFINVYFGGTLLQDIKGHRIENEGKHGIEIFENTPFYGAFKDLDGVNSTHHQCIDDLGKGLTLFARADDGTPEGIWHESGRIFAVQWHPERILDAGGDKVYELVKRLYSGEKFL